MSRRQGCVYKHGRGYAIKLELPPDPLAPGKRRYHREFGFPTKKEAEGRLAEVVAQLRAGTYVRPTKRTLAEYAEEWLQGIKPNLSPRTWEGYAHNLRKHILPYLGRVELTALEPLAVKKLYAHLLEQELAPKTVLYVHQTLHAALQEALRMGMVGRNVCDAVRPPKVERKEMVVLTEQQGQALLAGITDLRLLVPVALALGCGLRRGEVLGLRWQDVDLEAGRIQVVQTIQRLDGQGMVTLPPKTHGSRRSVDLPAGLVEILRAWRDRQAVERIMAGSFWKESGLVCTSPTGAPLDPAWVSRTFAHTVRALELPPVRFHDLRHSCASILLARGVHPKIVSELLGHASVKITLDTYSHVVPGLKKEAARHLDGIFRAASKEQGSA